MRAEIWFGGNKAYCIDAVKRLDWSVNERIIKITDHPTEKGGEG